MVKMVNMARWLNGPMAAEWLNLITVHRQDGRHRQRSGRQRSVRQHSGRQHCGRQHSVRQHNGSLRVIEQS